MHTTITGVICAHCMHIHSSYNSVHGFLSTLQCQICTDSTCLQLIATLPTIKLNCEVYVCKPLHTRVYS